jgi:hypothetical protein
MASLSIKQINQLLLQDPQKNEIISIFQSLNTLQTCQDLLLHELLYHCTNLALQTQVVDFLNSATFDILCFSVDYLCSTLNYNDPATNPYVDPIFTNIILGRFNLVTDDHQSHTTQLTECLFGLGNNYHRNLGPMIGDRLKELMHINLDLIIYIICTCIQVHINDFVNNVRFNVEVYNDLIDHFSIVKNSNIEINFEQDWFSKRTIYTACLNRLNYECYKAMLLNTICLVYATKNQLPATIEQIYNAPAANYDYKNISKLIMFKFAPVPLTFFDNRLEFPLMTDSDIKTYFKFNGPKTVDACNSLLRNPIFKPQVVAILNFINALGTCQNLELKKLLFACETNGWDLHEPCRTCLSSCFNIDEFTTLDILKCIEKGPSMSDVILSKYTLAPEKHEKLKELIYFAFCRHLNNINQETKERVNLFLLDLMTFDYPQSPMKIIVSMITFNIRFEFTIHPEFIFPTALIKRFVDKFSLLDENNLLNPVKAASKDQPWFTQYEINDACSNPHTFDFFIGMLFRTVYKIYHLVSSSTLLSFYATPELQNDINYRLRELNNVQIRSYLNVQTFEEYAHYVYMFRCATVHPSNIEKFNTLHFPWTTDGGEEYFRLNGQNGN